MMKEVETNQDVVNISRWLADLSNSFCRGISSIRLTEVRKLSDEERVRDMDYLLGCLATYINTAPAPIPATYSIGSDRYAYHVAQASTSGKTVTTTDGQVFTWRRKQGFMSKGKKCGHLFIGVAREHMDPSF